MISTDERAGAQVIVIGPYCDRCVVIRRLREANVCQITVSGISLRWCAHRAHGPGYGTAVGRLNFRTLMRHPRHSTVTNEMGGSRRSDDESIARKDFVSMVGSYSCRGHIYHRPARRERFYRLSLLQLTFWGHPGQISYHSLALLTKEVGI